LTPALETQIKTAETMAVLEDIYLPFRPKRRTKATIAKEKGLEPLADKLFGQEKFDIDEWAKTFISEEKGVKTIEEALAGARDIIAEKINEDQTARAKMRDLFAKQGKFKAKVMAGKEQEGAKFKDYFDWTEEIAKAPSHRVLALRRAEKEMIISLESTPEDEEALVLLENLFVKAQNKAAEQVKLAVKDGYKRLLAPSMETEVRMTSKRKADEEAVKVFADNLRQLLMAAPLGQKNVLALDPGFRTGCKVVCLDKQGQMLHHDVIYPHEPQRQTAKAGLLIQNLCKQYDIEAIAIGNGTAGRETETFVKSLNLSKVMVVMVNESGASIYSASEVARAEFADYDLTVRGAVSIGRRLMDPLAELVKIDPKSIGVGQYQHDVDQSLLKTGLDDIVMSCVNAVGVELNTASKEILMYVSGLGESLAKNIVEYRNKNGAFKTRAELKKVTRLGEKAYEQAAGFLRIRHAANPLDASAVHPESYHIVEQMAKDLSCAVQDLMSKKELREQIKLEKYVTAKVGLPTLQDILKELAKPGRDPREQFEAFSFTEGVNAITDLKLGMKLAGIVTNVTDFGAFIDIGVHQDGLVHISQISEKRIKHPSEVLKVQMKVMVTVTEVDIARKRIALSMKENGTASQPAAKGFAKKETAGVKVAEKEETMEEKLAKLKGMFKK
jgi:protein Tex